MPREYVSRVRLAINGQEISDFKSFTEGEIELGKAVNLMNTTGYMSKLPRYGLSLEYVVPENASEFDFTGVKDATLTVTRESGAVTTFSGVCILKIGAAKADGDNEETRTIDLMATGKN